MKKMYQNTAFNRKIGGNFSILKIVLLIYLTISSVVFNISSLLIVGFSPLLIGGLSPLLIGDSSILVISTSPSGLTILRIFEFALGVPKRSSSDSSSEDTSVIGAGITSLTKLEPFLGASGFRGVTIKWFEVWLNNGRFLPNLSKENRYNELNN